MRRGTSQPSSARTPNESSSNKFSMAANATVNSLRHQMRPSSPISHPPPTAKTTPLSSQCLPIWSVFGWMSCPSMSSRRWFFRRKPVRWTCSSLFSSVWRNLGRGCSSSGRSHWNLIICRVSCCPSWQRGRRSVKNLSWKLQRMRLGRNFRLAQGILSKISKRLRIKKGVLRSKSLT